MVPCISDTQVRIIINEPRLIKEIADGMHESDLSSVFL